MSLPKNDQITLVCQVKMPYLYHIMEYMATNKD
jgi:hypothetical protein